MSNGGNTKYEQSKQDCRMCQVLVWRMEKTCCARRNVEILVWSENGVPYGQYRELVGVPIF